MRTLLNLPAACLSILFCFATFYVNAQTQDTAIYQYQPPGNPDWINSSMDIYHYNSNCQYNNVERYSWNSTTNSWDIGTNSIYTYTSAGVLVRILDQVWNSTTNTWQNQDQTNYSTQGAVETRTTLVWNTTDNQWHKLVRDMDSLDNYGNVVARETFFASNDEWFPSFKLNNIYNGEQQTGDISFQFQNGTWFANNKHRFNYSNNDLSIDVKGFYRISEQDPWIAFGRDIKNLNAGTKLESSHLQQALSNNEWINQYRDSFTYTNTNQPYKAYHQYWDAFTGTGWIKLTIDEQDYYKDGSLHYVYNLPWGDNVVGNYGYKATYTHHACILHIAAVPEKQSNSISQKLAGNSYIFDGLPLHDANGKNIVSHYMLTTSKATSMASLSVASNAVAATFAISPNPAKNYFNITINNTGSASSTVRVSDIAGKIVLQKQVQGNGIKTIDLPALQKGIYIVTLISGKQINSQKLVVE